MASDKSDSLGVIPAAIISVVALLCVVAIVIMYCRRQSSFAYNKAFEDDNSSLNSDVMFTVDSNSFRFRGSSDSEDDMRGEDMHSFPLEEGQKKKKSKLVRSQTRETAEEMEGLDGLTIERSHYPTNSSPPPTKSEEDDQLRSKKNPTPLDMITHNVKKMFNRPRSLKHVSTARKTMSVELTDGDDTDVDRSIRGRWFADDLFDAPSSHPPGDDGSSHRRGDVGFDSGGQFSPTFDSDIDDSAYIRQPYSTSAENRSRLPASGDIFRPSQFSTGSDLKELEQEIVQSEIDDFPILDLRSGSGDSASSNKTTETSIGRAVEEVEKFL